MIFLERSIQCSLTYPNHGWPFLLLEKCWNKMGFCVPSHHALSKYNGLAKHYEQISPVSTSTSYSSSFYEQWTMVCLIWFINFNFFFFANFSGLLHCRSTSNVWWWRLLTILCFCRYKNIWGAPPPIWSQRRENGELPSWRKRVYWIPSSQEEAAFKRRR